MEQVSQGTDYGFEEIYQGPRIARSPPAGTRHLIRTGHQYSGELAPRGAYHGDSDAEAETTALLAGSQVPQVQSGGLETGVASSIDESSFRTLDEVSADAGGGEGAL